MATVRFCAGPGLGRQVRKFHGAATGTAPVGREVQLAQQAADDPGDPVLGAAGVPADDVDLTARPAQNPLELIEVQGRGGMLWPHFQGSVNKG
jgi:hypothetical protein